MDAAVRKRAKLEISNSSCNTGKEAPRNRKRVKFIMK
jgi:hypothetical protein